MAIETTLDPNFSDPAAEPTPWATATAELEAAKTYFLVTVRPDGRPHATTVAGIWLDGAFHFVTGPSERKAKNLAAGNARVLVATGCSRWDGLDIVLEGEAVRVTDPDRLGRIAEAMTRKYDDFFGMRIRRRPAGGRRRDRRRTGVRGPSHHRFRVREGADVRPDPLAVLTVGTGELEVARAPLRPGRRPVRRRPARDGGNGFGGAPGRRVDGRIFAMLTGARSW